MSLTPGTRLGAYEVVSQIGSGGMGVVYKARDTALNRDVALKVLPESLAGDPDRLMRFEREAQALAALNHANIAQIYGIEHFEPTATPARPRGQTSSIPDGGQTPSFEEVRPLRQALVLEYVEGPTLAERIQDGPIPLDEALPIARQIAEGLEAAHERGILHRDLKPANIKVREDGAVKLLDFGLAKALAPEPTSAEAAELANSPTLTARSTQMGIVLGTAAYMAPEQAKGKSVDKRVDVWAFGVVLFEMLTGKRPFDGEDVTDVLAAVVRAEPDWNALPATTPRAIERLLRRCLVKQHQDRLHDIGDARLEVDESAVEVASGFTRPPLRQPGKPGAGPRRAATYLAWFTAGVVLAILGVWTVSKETPRPSVVLLTPAEALAGTGPVEARSGLGRPSRTALALSPDGSCLVFVGTRNGRQQLFVRRLDELAQEAVALEGTDAAESPFFSPRGDEVGYWSNGALWRIPIDGGQPVKIVETERVWGVSWGDDGTIAYSSGQTISQVAADRGVPTLATLLNSDLAATMPWLLPAGRGFIYTDTSEGVSSPKVGVWPSGAENPKILVDDAADGRYVPTGHLVFMRSGTLMAAGFNLDTLEVTSDVVGILGDVMQAYNAGNSEIHTLAGQYTFAASGAIAYVTGGVFLDPVTQLSWFDRSGRAEPLAMTPGDYLLPVISHDGRYVAMRERLRQGGVIAIYDIKRGTVSRLPSSQDRQSRPVWSPGDEYVSFHQAGRIFQVRADGTGSVDPLVQSSNSGPADWGPAGELIFLADGVIMARWPDGELRPVLKRAATLSFPALSPDGRWIAYVSDESGGPEVYVRPYPSMAGRFQVSVDGGDGPVWTKNGRELIYRKALSADTGRFVAVQFMPDATDPVGAAQDLFEKTVTEMRYGTPRRGYDVTSDGQRLLGVTVIDRPTPPAPPYIHVTENWFEELKARVPVR